MDSRLHGNTELFGDVITRVQINRCMVAARDKNVFLQERSERFTSYSQRKKSGRYTTINIDCIHLYSLCSCVR